MLPAFMIKRHREFSAIYTVITPLGSSSVISIFNRLKPKLIGNSGVFPKGSLTFIVQESSLHNEKLVQAKMEGF